MKSRIFLLAAISNIAIQAQIKETIDSTYVELESAKIIEKLPLTTEKFNRQVLQNKNLGQDIPTLLNLGTSVTTTSDAGAGIGYSSLRIRGISQEHININFNGVPLNDGESQSVFWVNMPDLISSSSGIQIQRGVGTSTSGTGNFGAIIQIDQNQPSYLPFLESHNAWGSFNTQKYNLQGGTGTILDGKLRLDINASLIQSDGYIDRAKSEMHSYGMNLKYDFKPNSSLRYWTFFGKEKTYQAWNGIDAKTMKTNRAFNSAGAIYDENWENIIGFYPNETDNYQQHHNHLIWDQKINDHWNARTTFYYTRGKGYYENYKQDADLADYNYLDNEIENADLVRQKWLDNHFYGVNVNVENLQSQIWKFWSGISISRFENQHYGKVIWIKDLAEESLDHQFYKNDSDKIDLSVYAKVLRKLGNLELFADLQYRMVDYQTEAKPENININEEFRPINEQFNFVNPKIGFNYFIQPDQQLYFYYGLAHREPNRSDYMDNSTMPKAEKLHDFEFGLKKNGKLSYHANLFYMYYIDQLVATGKLNDVGAPIRMNSGKSFRTGIEISASYQAIPNRLNFFGNVTFSKNQNLNYFEEVYDESWNATMLAYGDTDISFSPNWIGALGAEFKPTKNLLLNIANKYVGKQFMTNTEIKESELDAYFLTDLLIQYSPNWFDLKNLSFSLLLNNLFNKEYASNGYYYEGAYYYPQAGINVLAGVRFRF